MLAHFYIEVKDEKDQARLERAINAAGWGFYDAGEPFEKSLEEIEAILEGK